MPASPGPASANMHLLSRNPIFTSTKNVWGYEIQAIAGMITDAAPNPEQLNIGATIIAGDYIGLNSILARSKKILLAYTKEQLLAQIPDAFPAQSSAILLPGSFQIDTDLTEAVLQLAANGHTLALEWDPHCTTQTPILNAATMLCLNSPSAVTPGLAPLIASGKICVSRNVSTAGEFESLQQLGVTLFQGRYFKIAEIIPGRKISSHQSSRLQIMRIIEDSSPDLDSLAKTIQADVSLSYRLLTYLNSPTFGFMRKIDSIRQAITMLGWVNVRNWLRAVLLADIAQGEQQIELLHMSLWRGRFLEQMVVHNDYWDFKSDEMFLLGMFSLLDAILGIPMADALAFLPLTDVQKKALRGEGATEYTPLLAIMNAFEDQNALGLTGMLQDLSLEPEKTKRMHYEAGAWATSILEIGQGA